MLGESSPEEIVEEDYRLQRLVYALACFRAGADEVEVVYHFLERPDAVVSTTFTRAQLEELEAELSEAIAQIQAGEFRPTPSEFACTGCPALDLVCAGIAAARDRRRARGQWRVATSRRRGSGSGRSARRIRPIIERLAASTRTPRSRSRSAARSSCSCP